MNEKEAQFRAVLEKLDKEGSAEVLLASLSDTKLFGRMLADTLKAGDFLAMSGDLGAGKTTLTKAIGEGLGVTELMQSPTFTIIREYESGRLPLYHFDVYRLEDPDELYELGYEEYFYGNGVSVVEWAGMVEDFLPKGALQMELSYTGEEEQRLLRLEKRK